MCSLPTNGPPKPPSPQFIGGSSSGLAELRDLRVGPHRLPSGGPPNLIMNPPGAWAVAVRDAPEVAEQLWTFHSPKGPKGRFDPCSFGFWGIWNFSANAAAAKSLLMYLSTRTSVEKLVAGSHGVDAGTSPGENRPARHRVAEARVLGVAAWRTGPLQHGARADDCRRGRQTAEPGARVPGGRTHAHQQPDQGYPGPAGHSQLQTNPAPGSRTSGNRTHPGGHAAAAKCLGRAATRHGAARLDDRPDPIVS